MTETQTCDMKDLFTEWRSRDLHKGGTFIEDGIINEEKWKTAPVKILFLLKEAHTESSEGCLPYNRWINKRVKDSETSLYPGNTLHSLANWTHGIFSLAEGKGIVPYLRDMSYAEMYKLVQKVAIINIKKSNGKKASDNKDLKKYVDEDWDLIEKQIALCAPDLVVCGYVFWLIRDKFKYEETTEWVYDVDGVPYVNFWHPSTRNGYPMEMTYYSLCALLQMSGILTGGRLTR